MIETISYEQHTYRVDSMHERVRSITRHSQFTAVDVHAEGLRTSAKNVHAIALLSAENKI